MLFCPNLQRDGGLMAVTDFVFVFYGVFCLVLLQKSVNCWCSLYWAILATKNGLMAACTNACNRWLEVDFFCVWKKQPFIRLIRLKINYQQITLMLHTVYSIVLVVHWYLSLRQCQCTHHKAPFRVITLIKTQNWKGRAHSTRICSEGPFFSFIPS